MPIVTIDGPPGLSLEARRRMMQEIHTAVEAAYEIGETTIFVREHSHENVAFNGAMPGGPGRRARQARPAAKR